MHEKNWICVGICKKSDRYTVAPIGSRDFPHLCGYTSHRSLTIGKDRLNKMNEFMSNTEGGIENED